MQRKFKLNDKIDNLIVCTGPGSYTAMRIGIAFMYGISITKKIPLIGISGLELLKFATPKQNHKQTLFLIKSSNDQNFFSIYSKKNNSYLLNKINNSNDKNIFNKKYSYKIANSEIDSSIIEDLNISEYKIISFSEIVNSNLEKILLKKLNKTISPIYIEESKF